VTTGYRNPQTCTFGKYHRFWKALGGFTARVGDNMYTAIKVKVGMVQYTMGSFAKFGPDRGRCVPTTRIL